MNLADGVIRVLPEMILLILLGEIVGGVLLSWLALSLIGLLAGGNKKGPRRNRGGGLGD